MNHIKTSSASYSQRLHKVIPGGAHTYSRGDDQYPSNAPPLFKSGHGAYLCTPEGEEFLDYGMSLRAVTLGYAEKTINDAAMEQIAMGNNLTRPSLVELEAAEALVELIPSVDMVKFTKNGSNATTAAIKLARAYTGRKYVIRCLEHPFFSFDDWFIGNTPLTLGIPQEVQALTLNFKYNDISSLELLFDQYKDNIACVIMEPATTEHPQDGFLQHVKNICHKNGAIFILDEMITGFRWHLQGAQTYYDLDPDLSTFGKGMANGFSVSALAGKKEIMKLGGIKDIGNEKLFLLSTTHGGEMCGLGSFLATIKFYQKHNVIKHLWDYGEKLISGINDISAKLGIGEYFKAEGIACSPVYTAKDKRGAVCLGMRTLFAQEMIKHHVLIPWVALSFAHTDKELQQTLYAVENSLKVYCLALDDGYKKFLKGDPIKPVFRKHL